MKAERQAGGIGPGRLGRLRRGGGRRREPDLTSLINIVFLILVFFVVAGALRPFSARDVVLAKVAQKDAGAVSPGRLIIRRDGRLTYRGRDVGLDRLAEQVRGRWSGLDQAGVFTIVADGRLPATRVLEVSRVLKASGVERMALMVERSGK